MIQNKTGIALFGWALVLVATAPPAFGGLLGYHFDTGTVDPLLLEVGTPFQVSIELDRQGSGLELSLLGTTVLFSDPTHFDAPSDLSPGAIVPIPFDLFFPPSPPGSIDTQYSNFFSGPPGISADGEFFSFTLTPIAEGTGTLMFAPFSNYALDQNDPGNFIVDFDLDVLNYTVVQTGGGAVPEPSSLFAFAAIGLSGIAMRCRLRRRA